MGFYVEIFYFLLHFNLDILQIIIFGFYIIAHILLYSCGQFMVQFLGEGGESKSVPLLHVAMTRRNEADYMWLF
jgi:hypothetical protein